MIPSLPLDESTAQALAQTLLHFLWQGFALWMCALCVLHVASRRTAQTRYALHCGLLMLLALCPIATFLVVSEEPSQVDTSTGAGGSPSTVVQSSDYAPIAVAPLIESRWPAFFGEARAVALRSWVHRHHARILAVWVTGMALFAARIALGAVGVWMIVRRRQPLPPQVAIVVDRLARRMAFRARPLVAAVDNLAQAAAVGLLKPMVLLPLAWICELPGDVLEAVIAHELAHIRRWDLRINFVQRLIETALFFHPVVWWCSRRLRIEREMCCDQMALAAIGDRAGYAKALTFLASQRLSPSPMVLAAGIRGSKMVLLERIRNVLGLASAPHGRLYGPGCASAGAAAASIVWLVVLGGFHGRGEDEELETPSRTISVRNPPAYGGFGRPFKGKAVNSNAALAVPVNWPSEKAKAVLPAYTIEPPDVLFIEAIRVVPKAPYRIQSADLLSVAISGIIPAQPDGPKAAYLGGEEHAYAVDASGRIDLGLYFGKVQVSGMTEDEAVEAIRKTLQNVNDLRISLHMQQTSGIQPINGEHLVSPDGTVNLGTYGQVQVAGLTLEKATAAIEEKLAPVLDNPQVSVSVFAFNSKVYYVISENGDAGDMAARLPITGNETVLDAISQVNGLSRLSSKTIWIARPAPGEGCDTILPVDWTKITEGADTASNYQVMPGDRIFVTDQKAHTEPRAAQRY